MRNLLRATSCWADHATGTTGWKYLFIRTRETRNQGTNKLRKLPQTNQTRLDEVRYPVRFSDQHGSGHLFLSANTNRLFICALNFPQFHLCAKQNSCFVLPASPAQAVSTDTSRERFHSHLTGILDRKQEGRRIKTSPCAAPHVQEGFIFVWFPWCIWATEEPHWLIQDPRSHNLLIPE